MSEHTIETLGDALPKEMARVRDELLPVYDALPDGVGTFGAWMLRRDLDAAARAMAEGDLPEMIRCYKALGSAR